jgi:hypothetical protein
MADSINGYPSLGTIKGNHHSIPTLRDITFKNRQPDVDAVPKKYPGK